MANWDLTFPSTCHSTWHMANTAQGKHEFNFYKHIPQHMAHGSRAHGKKGFNFYNHAPQHMANRDMARHIANTYSTFTNTNQGTWQTWQTHIKLLQAWFFLTNIYS